MDIKATYSHYFFILCLWRNNINKLCAFCPMNFHFSSSKMYNLPIRIPFLRPASQKLIQGIRHIQVMLFHTDVIWV